MRMLITAIRSWIVAMAIVAGQLATVGGVAAAQGLEHDAVSCADDEPCFNAMYESGNTVVFRFNGIRNWEFYNVRYPTSGGVDKQVENRSGSFTFTGTLPGRSYKLSVQGCNSHTLARSTCSRWVQASFTTAEASASASAGPFYRLQLKQGGRYLESVDCSAQVGLTDRLPSPTGDCRLWRFVPAGNGWSRLQVKQGGRYLDASYCSTTVVLRGVSTYAAGACQLWRFVPAGNGWSRLQLMQGGKYLDASYCSNTVVLGGQSTYAAGACQLWRFVRDYR